ncbi:MAG: S-layer homology domain-containing protein [Candidatus Gracilibacteria bacterium]|jgi:hypothetical protein
MKTKFSIAVVAVVFVSFFFLGLFRAGDFFLRTSVTQSGDATVKFTDDLPVWASDSINRLSSAGVINGYSDGRFGASDNLTRGQVVTLLYRTLKYKGIIQEPDSASCSIYSDVKDTNYSYLPVCFLALNSGTTVLNSDPAMFSPDTPVTRGEAAKLMDFMLGDTLLKAMNETRKTDVVFQDIPKDNPYFDNIALVYLTGLMTGKSSGVFDPNGLFNRAEIAVVMDRTLNLLETLKIKKLAEDLNKDAYLEECADLIDQQTDTCSGYENWSLDIQVLKQDTKTKKSDIEIDKMTYGPGNKCSSSEAGEKFPANIKSGFLSNMESGGGKDVQMLCKVTCMGWSDCSEDEELVNKCTGESQTTSDCVQTCGGMCQASPDQANCSICVPDDSTVTDDDDVTEPTVHCGEYPSYEHYCSKCSGLPSYPTFQYEDCLTSCGNEFHAAEAEYNKCTE